MAKNKPVIWVGWEQKYFSTRGWTGQIRLNPLEKIARLRTGFWGLLRSRTAGRRTNSAKGFKGVLEVGDNYRAVYTVRFEGVLYVLRLSKEIDERDCHPAATH